MNTIGLSGKSDFWEGVLSQLGIPCRIFSISELKNEKYKFAALIIIQKISDEELTSIKRICGKNTVIIYTPEWGRAGQKITGKDKFAWKDEEYRFEVETEVYQPEKDPGEKEAFFPLKHKFSSQGTSERKLFYYSRKELPSERVSKADHYEIIRFARNFLVEVFGQVGKVLSGYSTLPASEPLFIFRIDTDFAGIKESRALYELCNRYNISATWFVDVHSEEILDFYQTFQNQEIGLHCDRHFVYKDKADNLINIQNGLNRLMAHKIYPAGFAAPFGEWNAQMEETLFDLDFNYSSEFSFAYDSLPIVRRFANRNLVQMPIHPVSPGRLRRSHFNAAEMLDYYLKYVETCRKLNLPAIIYHHPSHGLIDVIEGIFKYIRNEGISNITMLSYASWWLQRFESLLHGESAELLETVSIEKQIREFPFDYARKYQKNWRWYLSEYESIRSRRYFKRYGYPAKLL